MINRFFTIIVLAGTIIAIDAGHSRVTIFAILVAAGTKIANFVKNLGTSTEENDGQVVGMQGNLSV